MRFFALVQVVIFCLPACRDPNSRELNDRNTTTAVDTTAKTARGPELSTIDRMKISAQLIYNDGSLSSFDILNDKAVALWNVIGGGGDAIKPSNSSIIHFSGDLGSTIIKIRNGRRLALDTALLPSGKAFDYTVSDTGCEEVYINVFKKGSSVYKDTIPFHCGE